MRSRFVLAVCLVKGNFATPQGGTSAFPLVTLAEGPLCSAKMMASSAGRRQAERGRNTQWLEARGPTPAELQELSTFLGKHDGHPREPRLWTCSREQNLSSALTKFMVWCPDQAGLHRVDPRLVGAPEHEVVQSY